ncbi:hypothetical protein [Streptomyces sp. 2A115]|uniref:hypothetical protein n=1 Tax=Streptomyces sp. 2A115 TaxID=3457439 RepID=UPI003FD48644
MGVGEAVSGAGSDPAGAALSSGEVLSAGAAVSVEVAAGVVSSTAYAAGSAAGASVAVVPGSISLRAMPSGRAVAVVPSAAVTRSSTASAAPVHSTSVPPSAPARFASAPSAASSVASGFHPDHSPVSRLRARLGRTVERRLGPFQVSRRPLNRSVSCLSTPLRPLPRALSFMLCTDAGLASFPGLGRSSDGQATA